MEMIPRELKRKDKKETQMTVMIRLNLKAILGSFLDKGTCPYIYLFTSKIRSCSYIAYIPFIYCLHVIAHKWCTYEHIWWHLLTLHRFTHFHAHVTTHMYFMCFICFVLWFRCVLLMLAFVVFELKTSLALSKSHIKCPVGIKAHTWFFIPHANRYTKSYIYLHVSEISQ